MIALIALTGMSSYLLAVSQLEENAYNNLNDTVFQTKEYLENRLSDVFEQLVSLSNDPRLLSVVGLEDEDPGPQNYIEVSQLLRSIHLNNNTVIDSIYMDIHNGKFVMYQSEYQIKPVQFDYKKYTGKYRGGTEGFYWQNLHPDDFFINEDKVISLFKMIGDESSRANGILLFNLRIDFFEAVLNKSLIGNQGYLTLVSPDGEVNSKEIDGEYQLDRKQLKYLQTIKSENGSYEFKNQNGENMLVIYDTIGTNRWKVAAVISTDEIVKKATYIKYVTLIVILILIIIAILLANFLARYISNPVSNLVKQTNKISEDNLVLVYKERGPKEITILNHAMEDLMIRIHFLLEQVKKEQEEKRQLEFAVLHTQINPHFLYNTLYSIKGLSDMGLNQDASAMITALSNYFRISISKGKEIISLEEEFTHIRNYLFIQEMRYGDHFEYTVELDDSLKSYHIIKLTLQPLIENAIYHGVKQIRRKGKIAVRTYELDSSICIEVIDNGLGIDEQRLVEIREELENKKNDTTIGIGLRSVHERIRIHFGKPYGLMIESAEEQGTKISVMIPKTKEG